MAVQQYSAVAVRNVAIATDFTECSERAVQHGLAIARHFGATLHFLHLVRPSRFAYSPEMLPTADEAANRDAEFFLDRLGRSHQLEGIEFRRWVEEGEVSEIVGDFVRDQKIDLLIAGTHGRAGLSHLVLGSIAQQIFHSVRCPVLIVGPRSSGAGTSLQLRRVLFSTDLSPDSLAALPWVATAVEEWKTDLDLLHVCSSGCASHEEQMLDLARRAEALLSGTEHGPIQRCLIAGKPAPSVLEFAARHHTDLIILGLKPHRALYNGPLWSHAYEIVRQSPCPVLSVRSGPPERT